MDGDTQARQPLPEVQAYIAAAEAGEKAYEAATKAAEEKYPNRYHWSRDASLEERRGYDKDLSAARKQYATAADGAWEQLGKSEDPLVRWIAENCVNFKRYAVAVLQALPATTEQLNDLAQANGWCGDWDYLRDEAIEAGVIPGCSAPSPARQAVLELIDEEACCRFTPPQKRRVLGLLDALAAEVKAETPQAAAA